MMLRFTYFSAVVFLGTKIDQIRTIGNASDDFCFDLMIVNRAPILNTSLSVLAHAYAGNVPCAVARRKGLLDRKRFDVRGSDWLHLKVRPGTTVTIPRQPGFNSCHFRFRPDEEQRQSVIVCSPNGFAFDCPCIKEHNHYVTPGPCHNVIVSNDNGLYGNGTLSDGQGQALTIVALVAAGVPTCGAGQNVSEYYFDTFTVRPNHNLHLATKRGSRVTVYFPEEIGRKGILYAQECAIVYPMDVLKRQAAAAPEDGAGDYMDIGSRPALDNKCPIRIDGVADLVDHCDVSKRSCVDVSVSNVELSTPTTLDVRYQQNLNCVDRLFDLDIDGYSQHDTVVRVRPGQLTPLYVNPRTTLFLTMHHPVESFLCYAVVELHDIYRTAAGGFNYADVQCQRSKDRRHPEVCDCSTKTRLIA